MNIPSLSRHMYVKIKKDIQWKWSRLSERQSIVLPWKVFWMIKLSLLFRLQFRFPLRLSTINLYIKKSNKFLCYTRFLIKPKYTLCVFLCKIVNYAKIYVDKVARSRTKMNNISGRTLCINYSNHALSETGHRVIKTCNNSHFLLSLVQHVAWFL